MNSLLVTSLGLIIVGGLSSCSGTGDSEDSPANSNNPNLTEPDAVLVPEDRELLGRCTFASVHDKVCDEFFTTLEQGAADLCLPADDVGSLDDYWTVGGECPRENLIAACAGNNSIRYHYFGASKTAGEVEASCSRESDRFYRFVE